MKQFLLTLAVLISSFTTFAQKTTTHTVYFDVDSYTISDSEQKALETFLAQEKMNGHIGKVTIAELHAPLFFRQAYFHKKHRILPYNVDFLKQTDV